MDTKIRSFNAPVIAFITGALLVVVSIVLVLIARFDIVPSVDFDSCVFNGGVVEESRPRRCIINGATFIEQRSPVEENRETAAQDQTDQIIVVVGPQRVNCDVPGMEECLVVDNQIFPYQIQGFDYQEGNIYKIILNRTSSQAEDEDASVPGGQEYVFELDRVVSTTYVFTPEIIPEEIEEEPFVPVVQEQIITVGPFMVDCQLTTNRSCLVINGEPVAYDIEGFRHQAGYTYSLRIEVAQLYPDNGINIRQNNNSYRLLEELSLTALPGVEASFETGATSSQTSEQENAPAEEIN